MAIDLGKDPIILIILSFLEILLVLIPTLIASKVEKISLLDELKEMGFQRKIHHLKENASKSGSWNSDGNRFLFRKWIHNIFFCKHYSSNIVWSAICRGRNKQCHFH